MGAIRARFVDAPCGAWEGRVPSLWRLDDPSMLGEGRMPSLPEARRPICALPFSRYRFGAYGAIPVTAAVVAQCEGCMDVLESCG